MAGSYVNGKLEMLPTVVVNLGESTELARLTVSCADGRTVMSAV